MKNSRQFYPALVVFFILFCCVPALLYSQAYEQTSHGNKKNLPGGCRSCHKGHGVYNTPMLGESQETFCFRCHGNSVHTSNIRSLGYIASDVILIEVEKEFTKAYHHPIETSGLHEYREELPETIPSAPRHAACVDCHHHHYVTQENKHAGIKGTNVEGSKVPSIINEYELCFNCHSYSANLPSDQMNKASLLITSNPSYHPIVAQGKNNDVPSLQMPLTETSMIKCTDCHNNDDISGPKGPHGSSHMHLLKKNFNSDDSAEGLYQYELCYSCHMRASILNNESFRFHKLHLSVVGASCRTCHNPHGSTLYAHLIDLDDMSISPSESGALEFRDLGPRAGECFLSCHGKNHNPARYP